MRVRLPAPWSRRFGQLAYLPRLARGHHETQLAFAEERLIDELTTSERSLNAVGVSLSERVIEVPWILRSLPSPPARVLDVGTAFAPVVYKRLLVHQPQTVEVVDLAKATIPGLRSYVADIRSLPFGDAEYDAATCISTLEHIGMDNAQYHIESGGAGDVDALRELGRVARRVLVTVPAGADDDLGWLRQYSPATFRLRADQAGLAVVRMDVFAHDAASGWQPVAEDSVGDRHFGQGVYAAAALICAELERA
jgi:hypothetical protein